MKTKPSRPGHICTTKMVGALLEGPQTVSDLVEVSGLSVASVRALVLTFRKEGICYIADWDFDAYGRASRAAYALGKGRDVARTVIGLDRARLAAKARDRTARKNQLKTLHLLAA